MTVVRSDKTGERGKKDARRHREKQKEVIRKKLPDIISEENIITRRGGKTVKVPIRGVKIPDFRPGNRKNDGEGDGDEEGGGAAGIGQGQGSPGDVIGRRPAEGQGGQPGGPGEEPGEDFIETEIDIEEIIEMMFEDLGLPNIQEKEKAELEVILGHKIKGVKKSGPQSLEFHNLITRNAMGRFWSYMEILKSETGRDELDCFGALKKSGGNLGESLTLLENPKFISEEKEIEPFPIFDDDDMRFHDIKEDVSHESNAVVFIELDVSGSMSTTKKYLARSMMFWIVEFMRKIYDNVEVRFVIYHSIAKFVSEHDAFHTAESGGTKSVSAHRLVVDKILSKYPTTHWNVYVFQFSDGDDARNDEAITEIKRMIDDLKINMFGYGEILVDDISFSFFPKIFENLKENFPVDEVESSDDRPEMLSGKSVDTPLVAVRIKQKEDLWPAVQEFLKKGRWQNA